MVYTIILVTHDQCGSYGHSDGHIYPIKYMYIPLPTSVGRTMYVDYVHYRVIASYIYIMYISQ